MDDGIKALLELDFSAIIMGIFIILSAIVSITTLIGKFSVIVGKPVKWIKKKNEDHELLITTSQNLALLQNSHDESVKQSIRHDELIKTDLTKLSDTVDGIANTLEEMQRKSNETELKKLKDILIGYYNKFKDVGEWTELDYDSFWGLFDDYENRGGDGYIHSVVEPVMRSLRKV